MNRLALFLALGLSTAFCSAAESRPYTEGPVTVVTYIKVKPGMFENYMKWVATERKALMDEEKKAGIIVDSRIYTATARSPREADLVLTVTYKNMAALDNLDQRTDAITEKTFGSLKKADEASIAREQMREILGSEIIRELVLNGSS